MSIDIALLGGWGRRTGGSEGLLEALRAGKGRGRVKKICGGVRGRLRWVGPCGGVHRGDWIVGDGGVWWVEWWGQNCVGVAFTIPPLLSYPFPVTHNAPLHAFCQRIPVVVASVAEAEYAAAFGGGQVLVELTLTLTNLGHPQQSPPLLFVDNECAIGLATSSVRPKKSKSIDMRLDWIRERAGQNFFRLVFIPGLINPADFFTKILPIYRHISALPFLHGTPHHPPPPHNFAPTIPPTTSHHHRRSSRRDAVRHRDPPTLASP